MSRALRGHRHLRRQKPRRAELARLLFVTPQYVLIEGRKSSGASSALRVVQRRPQFSLRRDIAGRRRGHRHLRRHKPRRAELARLLFVTPQYILIEGRKSSGASSALRVAQRRPQSSLRRDIAGRGGAIVICGVKPRKAELARPLFVTPQYLSIDGRRGVQRRPQFSLRRDIAGCGTIARASGSRPVTQ